MNQKKKNIDIVFKEGLKGHRLTPSAAVWTAIENSLNTKKKTIFPIWLKWSAAAAILIFAFISGYYLAVNKTQNDKLYVEKPNGIRKTFKLENAQQKNKSEQYLKFQESTLINKNTNLHLAENTNNSTNSDKLKNNNSEVLLVDHDEGDQIIFKNRSRTIGLLSIFSFEYFKDVEPISRMVKNANQEIAALIIHNYFFEQHDFADPYNNNSINKKSSKWSLIANASPSYSYRKVSFTGSDQSLNYNGEFNNDESGLLAYAGQLNLNYDINSTFAFQTGLGYSRIGQISKDAFDLVDDGKDWIVYASGTSLGKIQIKRNDAINSSAKDFQFDRDSTSIINSDFNQTVDLLEIPLNLKMNLIDRKTNLSLNGGICPALLLNNQSFTKIEGQRFDFDYSNYYRSAVLFSMVSIDLEYEINQNLSLNMIPTFKYALTSINKNTLTKNQPYSLGWFTGIKYKF